MYFKKTNLVLIVTFIFLSVALVATFYKYYFARDYELLVYVDCDSEASLCQSDGESEYRTFVTHANLLIEVCGYIDTNQCVFDLLEKKYAKEVTCDPEYMEDWEICN